MTFLSGWTAIALAAGLTVPPLIALYFLKLRRRVVPVSSTFLWKRAVEDLHVNSPFQRLRSNLLLFLQLLVLLLGAVVLGKPVRQAVHKHEDTLILLIDQSASMGVVEADGRTRLQMAQEEAKHVVDRMGDRSRAMVVAFSDRATVVSSFDSDRAALKRKIDSIEPTQSLTRLTEAVALAEAYSQNLIIGGQEAGTDIAPTSAAPPATTLIFSDGRIEDLSGLSIHRLDTRNMQWVNVARRADNVGITSMSARRNYEQPDVLSVFAEVRNFGPQAVSLDANLYVDGQHRDVQTVHLGPGIGKSSPAGPAATGDEAKPEEGGDGASEGPAGSEETAAPLPGSVASVAFDPFEYGGCGVVEVRLDLTDALEADNRAWAAIDPPRHIRLLLVTPGNMLLEAAVWGLAQALPVQTEVMTPEQYEKIAEDHLSDGNRSKYDLVILDGHSTGRLVQGSYFFWGAVPKVDGVAMGEPIENEIIFNWDESHPILRHVPVDSIHVVSHWNRLQLPPEAKTLIEGESSAVLSYLTRAGQQYLICAFRLVVQDEESGQPLLNTFWGNNANFAVFMQNAVTFLSSSLSTSVRPPTRPGDPVALTVPEGADTLAIRRPDGGRDTLTPGKARTAHYARTQRVGVYHVERAAEGQDTFAVNLFSPVESNILPRVRLVIGDANVQTAEGSQLVNQPLWPYLLLAALGVLLLEWVVYNKRVFV